MKLDFKNTKGQIIIILLLLMLVVLSVVITITQRSITDLTSSTQSEQSSRAFSAAEAGIEKAFQSQNTFQDYNLGNNAFANVQSTVLIPTQPRQVIEYPPVGRETVAQFWLADPRGNSANDYTGNTFTLYFGNQNAASTNDKPAIQVSLVIKKGTTYYTQSYYLDSDINRTGGSSSNGFTPLNCAGGTPSITTIINSTSTFYCRYTIGPITDPQNSATNCNSPACALVLVRTRFLYINENHKLALAPANSLKLPPQVQIVNSTGVSGKSEKKLGVFRVIDVVPPWFDFAIFSIDNIEKN